MLATLLLTTLTASASGPAVFVPPDAQTEPVSAVKGDVKAAAKYDYLAFRRYVASGLPGLLCVNRAIPSRYYTMYAPTLAEVKAYKLEDGVWFCNLDAKGNLAMTRYTDAGDAPTAKAAAAVQTSQPAVKVAAAYHDPAGLHRHKCPIDGTVWTHADHSSGAGDHKCPTCGYTELNKYAGLTPPTGMAKAVTKPAVKAMPKGPAGCSCDGCTCVGGECGDAGCPAAKASPTVTVAESVVPTIVYDLSPFRTSVPTASCPSGNCPNAATSARPVRRVFR